MWAEVSGSDTLDAVGGRMRPRYGRARQTILAATDRLLRRVPLDALSMEDIAVAAGLSRRTVYNQFDNKHDLFRASRERHLQTLAGMIDTDLDAGDDSAAFAAFVLRTVRLFGSEPHIDVVISLMRDGHGQPWLGTAYRQQLLLPLRAAVEGFLFQRDLTARRRSADPRRDAHQFITLLQGLSAGRLIAGDPHRSDGLDADVVVAAAMGFVARCGAGESGHADCHLRIIAQISAQ